MSLNKRSQISFGPIVTTIGAILIGLGILWLIAQNWHGMHSAIKILILVISTTGAYSIGVILRIKKYPKTGSTLIFLGSILYSASVFLIAQIFSTDVSMQGTANLFLLCIVGVILIAYLLNTASSLVLGLIMTNIWIMLQYGSIYENNHYYNNPNIGILLLIFLSTAVIIYGIGLIHRASDKIFNKIYTFWSTFYLLIFIYILTFQSMIPVIWQEGIKGSNSEIVMLTAFVIAALISIAIGIFVNASSKKFSRIEVLVFSLIIIALLITILISGLIGNNYGTCYEKSCYDFKNKNECNNEKIQETCTWMNGYCTQEYCGSYWNNESGCKAVSERLGCRWNANNNSALGYTGECVEIRPTYDRYNSNSECQQYDNNRISCTSNEICKWQAGRSYYGRFSRTQDLPISILSLWILLNVIFIGFVVLIIGYGTLIRNVALINIGIIFFALDIISRYIGFIIDYYSGYNTLAIIFITGGCLLIFGGWLIEKWRRKMIQKARANN